MANPPTIKLFTKSYQDLWQEQLSAMVADPDYGEDINFENKAQSAAHADPPATGGADPRELGRPDVVTEWRLVRLEEEA